MNPISRNPGSAFEMDFSEKGLIRKYIENIDICFEVTVFLTVLRKHANDNEHFQSLLINPCHAEYFYVLHSYPIFIMLNCSIQVVSMYFQSDKVQKQCGSIIMIRWPCQNPADLDPECYQKRINQDSAGKSLMGNSVNE